MAQWEAYQSFAHWIETNLFPTFHNVANHKRWSSRKWSFFCSQTPIWNLDSRNWSFCQKFFTPFKSWVNVYFCGLSIINRHLSMTIAKIVLKILEFLNSWIQFSLLLFGPQKLFRKQLIPGHGEHYWGRMREP